MSAELTQERLIRVLQQNWSLEMDGVEMYAALAERQKIPERRKIFQKLSAVERKHADGLGSIFGIVSGVSGATLGDSRYVLLAGVSGMVASALSMGSGAFLAAKSEREIYEAELQREKEALLEHPDTAKEELAVFYQLKGVPEADSIQIANFLAANPDQFLKTMAAEKLKLTEDALSNPTTSALSGAISTAIGAFIPIVPFFFMKGVPAVIAAAIVSLVAHFAVGAAKSLVTVRSWWSSGMEMTVVGAIEGIVTYVIGIGLGHIGDMNPHTPNP